MVDEDKLGNALENNKNLFLICGGCGTATLIGADIEPDWDEPDKDCYMMYSCEYSSYKDKSITTADFESIEHHKGIEEIVYSHGIKVPMMTGMYATDYNNGKFSDRWYPDFYKIQRSDITVKEIMDFINILKYNPARAIRNSHTDDDDFSPGYGDAYDPYDHQDLHLHNKKGF